jgi:hypothetical protein
VGVNRTSGSGEHHAKSLVAAGFMLSCLVAAGGCSSSSPTASPATTAASPAATPTSTASFQISTPNGQVTLSLDGQLPPGWPSSFPVPPGAKVAGSGSVAGSSSGTRVAAYTTSQAPADAFAFYKDNSTLTTSGEKSLGVGSSFIGTAKITAPDTGSVTVVSHSGTTYIVVVLTS